MIRARVFSALLIMLGGFVFAALMLVCYQLSPRGDW